MISNIDTVVIGAGAAGLMAAGQAAALGKKVVLLEKNPRPARKLMITGKGRCNITNASDTANLIKNVPTNGRFLYSAFSQFSSQDTMDFFTQQGLEIKVERGNRVFPSSDKAVDVVDTLVKFARKMGVTFVTGEAYALQLIDNKIQGVKCKNQSTISCKSVVVATGGLSYPVTGSTGDGYKLAKQVGHSIIPLKPSLVPIEIDENWIKSVQGLSLKNVNLSVIDTTTQRDVFSEQGEFLFTHFGLSGPLVLSASAHMADMSEGRYKLKIDLKPALSHKQLDDRIIRDFAKLANKDFINSLGELLPRKLISVVAQLSKIPFELKTNQITKEQRNNLCELIKGLALTATKFRPIDEAIITSGGVNVAEINPKTMESKFVQGLYFAGEIIDADAYTGGFNLQIAFSTGYVCGICC